MSIENLLERIADALEAIAEVKGAVLQPKQNKPALKAAPVVEDAIPGMDEEAPTPTGMDNAGLRDLAQKYIQVAGDKTGVLVNFIKDEVCKKLNPKEPKLLKIPADKVAMAAKAIEAFAKKNGIVLPIEV